MINEYFSDFSDKDKTFVGDSHILTIFVGNPVNVR